MAHCLESDPRAVYLGKPAWHKLGTVVRGRMPLPEFLVAGRMNYLPILREVFVQDPDGTFRVVPGQFSIVRPDDGKILSPHTVTKKYHIVSPMMLAEPIAPFVNQGFASWDAAFTLHEGHSEVISARLDDISEPIDGDDSETEWYLTGQNYHGTSKVRYVLCGNRTVCANTVALAFSGGSDLAFSHTASVADRIANAPAIWEKARVAIKNHAAKLSRLNKRTDIPATVDALLGIVAGEKVPTRLANKRDSIVLAASNSPGTNGQTLLDIFNGITYLGTHDTGGKGGDDDSARFASMFDGTRGEFASKSLENLLVFAQ